MPPTKKLLSPAAPEAPPTLDDARLVLMKHWGHADFRPAQVPAIEALLARKDLLAVLPTGGGKSALFQIPALLFPGCALVISPLIALMKDQVDDCLRRGIPASYVNSHVDSDEIESRFSKLRRGEFKLFYVAPERMSSSNFRDSIQNSLINLLAVDEAHCASRWGHDFRPEYMNIHKMVTMLTTMRGRPPIAALTATATKDIEVDICRSLGMPQGYTRVVGDLVRPNLKYQVHHGNEWRNFEIVCQDIINPDDGRYVIYGGTRKGCERLADILLQQHPHLEHRVGTYHAGMTKAEREFIQEGFKQNRIKVVIATNAFGMGIDVPDIRAVIHFGIPGSIEDYCQESGRAGRDGKDSDVILLNSPYSIDLRQGFVDNANPPYACYKAVWDFIRTFDRGTTIALTGEEMADAIMKQSGFGLTDYQCLGVLSVLSSYGLVIRRPSDSGVIVSVHRGSLRACIDDPGPLSPTALKLANFIMKLADEAAQMTSSGVLPDVVSVTFEKEATGESLACSESAISAQLKRLSDAAGIEIERTFRGKTTEVVREMWNCDLSKEIPRETLERKRAREQARLDSMVGYLRAQDRPEYIRSYFLGA
jgi:ATP-dependent DNA helicase RecQ